VQLPSHALSLSEGEARKMEKIVDANLSRDNRSGSSRVTGSISLADRSILPEAAFQRMLSLERKRAQRSRKPFLLALLEMEHPLAGARNQKTLTRILSALDSATRDTDVTGWYKHECVVGVMFTEIAIEERSSILATIMTRVNETLQEHLTAQQFGQVGICFHLFPEGPDEEFLRASSNSSLYVDILERESAGRLG
jgi:hypothetical protein